MLHSRLTLWPIANNTGQMGDGRSGRAVNESESGEMRGVSGTGVSNGYGERQYEGGVRRASVYVCCTVYSSMYLYGKNMCVSVLRPSGLKPDTGPCMQLHPLSVYDSLILYFLAFSQRRRMTGSHNYAF